MKPAVQDLPLFHAHNESINIDTKTNFALFDVTEVKRIIIILILNVSNPNNFFYYSQVQNKGKIFITI